jgi:hypothetical protein
MPLINTHLVKITRPQISISTYLNRTFYHPQIIFNKKYGKIVKYIGMSEKTICDINKLTNQFDRKFLQLYFDIPNSDTYYFDNNEIIAYQFRNNYLLSSINITLSNNHIPVPVPIHTLSSIENTNKSNINNSMFDINKFIPTLGVGLSSVGLSSVGLSSVGSV